jgi:microcystin-dependent protein
MATITGLTASRMLEIEGESIVDGEIIAGNLILTKHDGTTINAGPVIGPPGPQGPAGPASVSSIPGEIKLWPGSALPNPASYGKWVWADGAVYIVADYPLAAGNIAAQWRTFAGASDPGAPNFRVPDLRGLVPAGMDAMPGGARANRMTRAVAITLAGRAGEETHLVTIAEMPPHAHGGGNHAHSIVGTPGGNTMTVGSPGDGATFASGGGAGGRVVVAANASAGDLGLGITASGQIIAAEGGNGAHENVQPTVFVPYIVKLDG